MTKEWDVIFLEPMDNQNPNREWCEDDPWGNGVAYVRFDLIKDVIKGKLDIIKGQNDV